MLKSCSFCGHKNEDDFLICDGCGKFSSDLKENDLSRVRKDFYPERLIKRAGIESLYSGRDVRLGGQIIIKMISLDGLDEKELFKETKKLQKIHHRGLSSLFLEFTENVYSGDKEYFFMFMLCPWGKTLKEMTEEDRIFVNKLPEALDCFRQMLDALDYLHSKGVVHGDVSPDRAVVSKGVFQFVDFGLCSPILNRPEKFLVDKNGFMAPEIPSKKPDVLGDVYSAGALFYYIFTGIVPSGETPVVPLKEIYNGTPERLSRLISDMMSKDREKRPATVGGAQREVERVIAETGDAVVEKINKQAPLFRAIEKNDPEGIRRHISDGIDINGADNDGCTALQYALEKGNSEAVRVLIEAGADLLARNRNDMTPLHTAAFFDNVKGAEMILEKGVDVDIKTVQGWTPLFIGALNRCTKITRYLISRGADVNSRDNMKGTIVGMAAEKGLLFSVRELTAAGADLTLKDSMGLTPFHRAVRGGNPAVVEHLLNEGADVEGGDEQGRKPIHIAASSGRDALISLLVKRGAEVNAGDSKGRTALHYAMAEDNERLVSELITLGADVNLGDEDGVTPLMFAALADKLKNLELLVNGGADVNREDSTKRTALFLALMNKKKDAVRFLLSKGADPQRDEEGRSFLHICAIDGKLEGVEMFLEMGFSPDDPDKKGKTPLDYAREKGDEKILDILEKESLTGEKHQTDVSETTGDDISDSKSTDEHSPPDKGDYRTKLNRDLHRAIINGEADKAIALLKDGAGVNVATRQGYTPLHLAVFNNDFELVKYLLDNSAAVDAPDKNDRTPLMIAARNNNRGLAGLLLASGASPNVMCLEGKTAFDFVDPENKGLRELLKPTGKPQKRKKKKKEPVWKKDPNDLSKGIEMRIYRDRIKSAVKGDDNNPLIIALQEEDEEKALNLIKQRVPVNVNNRAGITPLHAAARKGYLKVVKLLVSGGANINAVDNSDFRPIHCATQMENIEVLSVLLENRALLNSKDFFGFTPLHWGAYKGNTRIVKMLTENYPKLNERDNLGRTPLMIASALDFGMVVEVLLSSSGIDIDAQDNKGDTALHKAVKRGSYDVVRKLVQKGADKSITNTYLQTPLDVASQKKDEEIADFLRDEPVPGSGMNGTKSVLGRNGECRLISFIRGTIDGDLRELIEGGEDLNETDAKGKTALHWAVIKENYEAVKLLLEKGADASMVDESEWTPVYFAALTNNVRIGQLLVDEKVGEQRDFLNRTPLHLAAFKGSFEFARLLIDNGCSITDEEYTGWTPLECAIILTQEKMIEFLVGQIKDADDERIGGETPLIFALKNDRYYSAETLLRLGADPNAGGKSGIRPLDVAIEKNRADCVQLLVNYGADTDYKDSKGRTPIDLAEESEDGKIIDILQNSIEG